MDLVFQSNSLLLLESCGLNEALLFTALAMSSAVMVSACSLPSLFILLFLLVFLTRLFSFLVHRLRQSIILLVVARKKFTARNVDEEEEKQ